MKKPLTRAENSVYLYMGYYPTRTNTQREAAQAGKNERYVIMAMIIKASDIIAKLNARKDRSAWGKGDNAYALNLLDGVEELPSDFSACRAAILNGAETWGEYSRGGSALIYDGDIAERLCCPSELKKTRDGERRPNAREEWLDVQARALQQAAKRIFCAARE